MAFIGLDVGTTGCKATVIDAGGNVKSYAYQEYAPIIPAKGRAELDVNVVWEGAKKVLSEAAAKSGETIDVVTVATFGEVFALLDDKDRIIANAILYTDERGTQEEADIAEKISGKALYDISGVPLSSMYSLAKLLWVKKHTSDYDNAKYIMLMGDFITYRMTGERQINYSLASRTSMLDVRAKSWSTDVADRFGIDTGKFSQPTQPGQIVGKLRADVAGEIGISRDAVLVVGAHDQICAALGAGVLKEGDCVDGMGTSECITTILSNIDDTGPLLQSNFCIEPYVIPDTYVTLAFHFGAGAAIDWHRTTIDKDRNEAYKRSGKDIHAAMEAEVPDGPTSLFVLPHMAGTGTPHMDSTAQGAILGIRLGTSRGEIYKATMEGICFEIMLNAMLLHDVGTNISSITAVGGVSQSDMLMQIKSDIMGIPVSRLQFKEAGTMGLAMMSYVANGTFSGLEEAAGVMVNHERTFEPNRDNHAAYMERFAVYQNIYDGIQGMYTGK